MNFTDSPFERMMKQTPRYAPAPPVRKPPEASVCRNCGYWNGAVCVGTCIRKLTENSASDHIGPGRKG